MDYSIRTFSQMGHALKSIRQAQRMTQNDVAQKVGLLQKTVSALELGSEKSTLESLMKLLSALDCDLVISPRQDQEIQSEDW